ncbi:SGNH/GDSL hydrolase family protein [Pseudoxanthomonas sp. UTMC 1351]|uniref:SGNH/GDSL hydrolase family protein n=1 Tax=Pseudoxanthomonas sp. UTMC 1351 TaxID=2695853 RepID=UPI0034CEFCF8
MKQLQALLLATIFASSTHAIAQTPLPLHIGGRVATTSDGKHPLYRYQWPAIYFEAAFEGSEVSVRVADDTNRLRILIDGQPSAVLDRPGTIEHKIANLTEGRHTIRLEKLNESQDGTGTFEGFYIPASGKALPSPSRPRQIEFVGDSDMVGYGNTSTTRECTDEELFLSTDTQKAYGPQVAHRFNADYQINAYSGIGVIRNYDGMKPDMSMTSLYPRILFDNPAAYRNDAWKPQVIVVGLGGNDFVPAVKSDDRWKDQQALRKDFDKAYVEFLRKLRKKNPDAFILLFVLETYDADYAAGNHLVMKTLQEDGDKRIHLLAYPKVEITGCNWHPSLKDHAAMADTISAYVAAHPELWQGK